MNLRLLLAVVAVCAASLPPLFAADPSGMARYRGIHPLWPHGDGFCYIEVLHVHKKKPSDLRVYRVLPGEEHLFVGDPVALGYVGPSRAYFGPHPLNFPHLPPAAKQQKTEQIYCYLRTPHFHAHESKPGADFVSKAGVNWYVGEFPEEFERDRHNLWVNDSGAMERYQPPKATIADAPPGYRYPAIAEVRPPAPPPAPAPAAAVAVDKPGTSKGKKPPPGALMGETVKPPPVGKGRSQ